MDESIEEPDPPSELSGALIEEVDSLSARDLRILIEYAEARREYLDAPISELIEVDDDEEIINVEDRSLYTLVVKGALCDEGCRDCPHDPQVYVVTIERELDGGRHLHWENVGPVMEENDF